MIYIIILLYHLFIMSDNKQKIISDVYYDRSGYGSEDSKKKEPTIKMSDVEDFF